MKKKIILCMIVTVIICCSPPTSEVNRIYKDGVEITINNIEPYLLKNAPRKIELEYKFDIDLEKYSGNEICAIGAFDVDSDGTIYIYDTKLKKIVKFNDIGELIGSIGNAGQGPGEFQWVSDIRINSSGEIIATDNRNMKFVIFDKNGDLIKEIKIRFGIRNGTILDNGNIILKKMTNPDDESKGGKQVISLFDPEFNLIKQFDKMEFFNPFGQHIEGIHFNQLFDVSKNNIFIGNQKKGYEISVYDFKGNLVRKIVKDYKKIPPYKAYKARFLDMLGPDFSEMIKDKLYFPKYLPPFHYFLVDDNGNIYVQTYEVGNTIGEFVFDIFNNEGIFILRKNIKDFSEYEGMMGIFRNNHFYRVHEKENGFNKLEVYCLRWK